MGDGDIGTVAFFPHDRVQFLAEEPVVAEGVVAVEEDRELGHGRALGASPVLWVLAGCEDCHRILFRHGQSVQPARPGGERVVRESETENKKT